MTTIRFALSPAAHLHLGSARLALIAWTQARKRKGRFLLRLDDLAAPSEGTDLQRDLAWLGLDWDNIAQQSTRRDRFAEVAETLKAQGRLYPCFETPQELEAKRDHRARRGQPLVYDRAMLKLTAEQRARAEAGGKRPHWRFKLSDREIAWSDLTLGEVREKLTAISDPILLRADGTPTQALAAVVDDADDDVTLVIRSAEQTASTAVQLDLIAALNYRTPKLAHIPPMQEGANKRRPDGITIRQLRADGIEPAAITAYLNPGRDLADFTPTRFDIAALLAANRAILATMDHASVVARLPPGATEAFWLCIRRHIDLLPEARGWWDVVAGDIVPPDIAEESPLLREALAQLPPEPWPDTIWPDWRDSTATALGRPAPDIAQTLRLALTGEEHGPDMATLLPLIGRTRAAQRLLIAAC